MNTYSKYSHTLEADQVLDSKIMLVKTNAEDFLKENYEFNQVNSKKNVDKKLGRLFADFDKKGRVYDLQDINTLEMNVKKLLIAVKDEVRESDYGSERTALLMD